MKCNAHVFWGHHSRKNADKKLRPVGVLHDNIKYLYTDVESFRNLLKEHSYTIVREDDVCGGKIEVSIQPDEYGDYDFLVKCVKCGCTIFTANTPNGVQNLQYYLERKASEILSDYVKGL